jgi:hypothetical protein
VKQNQLLAEQSRDDAQGRVAQAQAGPHHCRSRPRPARGFAEDCGFR